MPPVKLLLDQMLDIDVAAALAAAGFDVMRVSELGLATAADDRILAKAVELDRVILTLDGHFGDWAVLPLHRHPGVIRIKANPAVTGEILKVLQPFFRKFRHRSFANTLAIVSIRKVRWIKTGI